MSISYTTVQWNRHKKIYDAVLLSGVGLYIVVFLTVGKVIGLSVRPGAAAISDEILLIRAFGTCAFIMLHLILCIGPLARLSTRLAPLLYNRRHFGVTLFCVALVHGTLVLGYYHGFGFTNPLISLLITNTNYTSLTAFPFEILGAAALLILFLMAATSHDFWLRSLSPGVWKALHMLVYVAYGLLVMHVTLGALQSEQNPIYDVLLIIGVSTVVALHLAAGFRERRRDLGGATLSGMGEQWIDVGAVDEIPNLRAKTVCLRRRERVAVYRYDGKLSAISNLCAHQNGPLGEGKIVDGCVTCPWHGYQYLAHNGQSPPPFTEKVPTYRVRVEGGRILLNPLALPPGTIVEPARIA